MIQCFGLSTIGRQARDQGIWGQLPPKFLCLQILYFTKKLFQTYNKDKNLSTLKMYFPKKFKA